MKDKIFDFIAGLLITCAAPIILNIQNLSDEKKINIFIISIIALVVMQFFQKVILPNVFALLRMQDLKKQKLAVKRQRDKIFERGFCYGDMQWADKQF